MAEFDQAVTVRQAYMAMIEYLAKYYERGHSDEIGGMLGGLSLLKDGGSADPAALQDFLRAVDVVVEADAIGGYSGGDFALR